MINSRHFSIIVSKLHNKPLCPSDISPCQGRLFLYSSPDKGRLGGVLIYNIEII
ncbi:MAG: hypothetical protein Q8S84_00090 [bacterium]|nr:hypothetical protein [bacterium]MDP3379995.1 hypothetical protein [bacterium]